MSILLWRKSNQNTPWIPIRFPCFYSMIVLFPIYWHNPQRQGILYIVDVDNGSLRSFGLLKHCPIVQVGLYIISMWCLRRGLQMQSAVYLIYRRNTFLFVVVSFLVFWVNVWSVSGWDRFDRCFAMSYVDFWGDNWTYNRFRG